MIKNTMSHGLAWAFLIWLSIGVSYPLITMQRTKSYKYESYLNRTTWGTAFGFGIDYVLFIQIGIIESSYIRTSKVRFIQGSV
jgi:hypothetical protein